MSDKKPSEVCKEAGLVSLKQIEILTAGQVKERTFINWFSTKPKLVEIILRGLKEDIPQRGS